MQTRMLGLADYQTVYDDMTAFTEGRNDETPDELWYLQHPPVFTQGQAGKAEHVLFPGDIPVVQTDRGGQVTYHGPGQLVVYLMIDIARRGWGPRQLVSAIEQAIVDTLAEWNIEASPRSDAPGVYTGERKIASLGLRIRHGRSFHGLALNIDMDLEPFRRINPCGYAGMEMTQMTAETDSAVSFDAVTDRLDYHLQRLLANDGSGTDETTPE
ncbi:MULTISPECIES: lipoyl(octanoyl) transferase LipB [Thalassolituus]|jgi:lipoyl(octanoyl) transferase|uniref:lipoyl(octanoyl) transferase LipB n=1 Tax=Thalassolituus TaxID=187492 RepID=UPI0007CFC507|nr:octanoyltransferase [Oleibacter sp. HI0075]MAX85564.1 lipoyl(octanoyl) transferase LipB [Oceanospirillaceae bacterium]MEE3159286.1 lipoyl(octanoyl) transferase LipB [Pseudomonadota bacterium]TPD55350.1 MAG: lipoyl(octanoyl) transferase LipB [Thalassolituus maritimus]HCG78928.1 lipoyl(octanoyl) transferase LipB [Oceanospirillales bacterium]|tara:strand:- start:2740 stop:3378 length:639 start_codon:yes stop_codon:yes gene_type:complete